MSPDRRAPQPHLSLGTVVVCVVSLSCVVVAAIVGLTIVGGPTSKSTPAILTILAFVGPTLAALLALIRQDRSRQQLDHVDTKVERLHERTDEIADVVANGPEGPELPHRPPPPAPPGHVPGVDDDPRR